MPIQKGADKMKKYLNNKDGMALPMVLIIMAILMTLASAMAIMAYNSLLSVRWMDEEKQAYYLSQAGVEATNQAYQQLLSINLGTNEDANSMSEQDKNNIITLLGELDDANNPNAKLITERVYLAYGDSDQTNVGTVWQGLHFTKNPASDDLVIGSFVVEIANGTDVKVDENGDESDLAVKVYRSTSTVGETTRVAYAYVAPPEFAGSGGTKPLYDSKGMLNVAPESVINTTEQKPKTFTDPSQTNGFTNVTVDQFNINEPEKIQGGGILGFFKRIVNGIIVRVFKALFGPNYTRNYETYSKFAEGNLVLPKPSETVDTIYCNENKDNFYVFGTTNNLFVQCGIDVTPTKGYYSAIGLYGTDIVVDGDITMYAYIPKRNLGGLDISFITNLINTFGNRYRLGTVVIGHGADVPPSREENRSGNDGGLKVPEIPSNDKLKVNRIFFNGNVYLKIEEQGSAVETYRVFESGDIAFFYGQYNLNTDGSNTGDTKEATGIDLTKYFIDAVIARADGYTNYSERTIAKLIRVKELYYGGEDESQYYSYISGNQVLIRKLSISYSSDGKAVVDGGKGTVKDLIQPAPVGSVKDIIWGRPQKGDAFQTAG